MPDQKRVPSKSTKYRLKRKASATVLMQGFSDSDNDSSDFYTPKRECIIQKTNTDNEFHLNDHSGAIHEPSCILQAHRSDGSSEAEILDDADAGFSASQNIQQQVEDWTGSESNHVGHVDPHLAQDVVADTASDAVNTSNEGDNGSDLSNEDNLSDDETYEEESISERDSGSDRSEFGDETYDEESMSERDSGSDRSEFGDEPRNENQDRHENGDTPLYEGAPLNVMQSILAVMTLCLTHSLTGSCVTDILALLALHCPPQNSCVRSMYMFQKLFSHVGRKILIRHYFCSGCYVLLANNDAVCARCGEGYDKSFFIEIPLVTQLQTMFKRPGFVEKLLFRFNRVKQHENNIEDIYDGRIYKEQFDGGFLQNPLNISLMWYTDGVSIFKSSKFSIWPLYFMINELNYKNRIKKQNIILAGLWFRLAKPKVNTYFQPFNTVLQHFKDVGYECEIPNGPPIRVKGILLCGTCDLPAKSAFLNFKQYNGFHGCARCKAPGQRYNEENYNVHVYPYSPNLSIRTNEEVHVYAREAVGRDTDVYGVKGPSILYNMVPNMIRSTAIDKMHGLGGLSKLLTILWFDPTHSNMPFSLSQMLDVVDGRLKSLSPPSFVPRMPRKIKETLAFWKSLEFKLWLLYYSIPILIGIMDEQYFQHHIKLVSAIYLLSQRSISLEQVENASHLLHEYVRDFEQLYGLRHMGMNVHQILHLPEVVLDLSPLWVYCCFPWEDLNGKLIKFCHGSRHIGLLICSSASIFSNLVGRIDQLDPESPISSYCEKLLHRSADFKIAEIISNKIYAVGTFIGMDNHAARSVKIILNRDYNILRGNFQFFKRLRKIGVMYSSEVYTRSNKKTSTYVAFYIDGEPKLGNLKKFVRWSQCECTEKCLCRPAQYFCLIEVYVQVPWVIHDIPHVRISYMNRVQRSYTTVAVPVSALECLCYYIAIEDDMYIIKPVNTLEAE